VEEARWRDRGVCGVWVGEKRRGGMEAVRVFKGRDEEVGGGWQVGAEGDEGGGRK